MKDHFLWLGPKKKIIWSMQRTTYFITAVPFKLNVVLYIMTVKKKVMVLYFLRKKKVVLY